MKTKIIGAVLAAAVLVSSPLTQAFAQEQSGEAVVAVPISATIQIFSDLSGHWAGGAVDTLSEKGVLPYDGPRFFPEAPVTKGELAMMLRGGLGIQMAYFAAPDIKDYFDDVTADAPCASAVIDLVTAGILPAGGSFGPEDTVSREEMTRMALQAYRYVMGKAFVQPDASGATFADSGNISAEYAADVAEAQREGLILGCGDDRFEPARAATRAEAAVLIARAAGLAQEQADLVTVTPAAVLGDKEITMSITIVNTSDKAVSIAFTSGQQFDFELLNGKGEALYRWSADKSFILAASTVTIEAGESLVLADTLSGDVYVQMKNEIASMKAFITGQAPFINSQGYEISVNAA